MKIKTVILAIILALICTVAWGQYTPYPPIYSYQIQPPAIWVQPPIIIPPPVQMMPAPVTVTVVPRPSAYTKTVRHPYRWYNFFKPWTPLYRTPQNSYGGQGGIGGGAGANGGGGRGGEYNRHPHH